ncbi:MAG: DUF362 domain-containing protein [Lentisphaerae bacterium]|nr:DUF362 domain-containing protein [Lentisphaerota bacterium]
MSEVLFADARVRELSAQHSLPAKFQRLLKKLDLGTVEGKSVAIKMHMGGAMGYSTIHPLFVRLLVQACKEAGAGKIMVMDGETHGAEARGYTPATVGAPVVSCFGSTGQYLYKKKIGFLELKEATYGGNAWDADVFIDFSHLKGHGMCGFGGAIKNIAMGCTVPQTRGDIHRIQGGISWDREKCIHCSKCVEECPNNANSFTEDGTYNVFWHNCTFCRHCVMICPTGSLRDDADRYDAFQEGLARVTAKFLDHFKPENRLFINVLLGITIYCDCWGFTSPALHPDVGILASRDIVAVEEASLDKIKASKMMPEGLPIGGKQMRRRGHLFERVHGKDPYVQIRKLEELGYGPAEYRIVEVR